MKVEYKTRTLRRQWVAKQNRKVYEIVTKKKKKNK